jgi:3-oxoacyl-[acyl-carrier protein] reductase
MRLQNKVAIITGGANGIGKATAERFAQEGARVAIWDLAQEAGRELAAQLSSAGQEVRFTLVDVRDSAAVEVAVRQVVADWGRVDILVNNAGILRDAQLVKYKEGAVQKVMTDALFDDVIQVNLRGVFVCARAVVPHMIEQGYGRILSASSVVGLYGNFGQTNYVAAKAGVIGMTKVWARELGRYGITANAVAPGFVETEMTAGMPDKILDMMKARIPVGRIGQPEDIAAAYLYLASDEAGFVNGATLSVDGGSVTGT